MMLYVFIDKAIFFLLSRGPRRYPGDSWEDSHGHGHIHAGDAHNEEEMDHLSGPVHDFGVHGNHEDSHVGQSVLTAI